MKIKHAKIIPAFVDAYEEYEDTEISIEELKQKTLEHFGFWEFEIQENLLENNISLCELANFPLAAFTFTPDNDARERCYGLFFGEGDFVFKEVSYHEYSKINVT